MILVGTSGWQYRDWRGRFYPDRLPQRLWLEHFAARFATVEVNNAFYRLPERDTFAAWRARTPDDFCVTVKMSRYLTHIKRLRDPAEPVARFLGRATALGDRLGPVLLQLPPNLPADPDTLDATLRRFPADVRVAVEPRHPSWWTPPPGRCWNGGGRRWCGPTGWAGRWRRAGAPPTSATCGCTRGGPGRTPATGAQPSPPRCGGSPRPSETTKPCTSTSTTIPVARRWSTRSPSPHWPRGRADG
ncbi:DUF72 domain-containing protein [Micromonospora sp. H33]|uniref:DUF72 domain-containing protein n=1 Tax=Micromonospora sp. H33 TaxID=3452215 RepID=UPI003F88B15F